MAGRPSVKQKIIDNLEKVGKLIRDGYTEEQAAKAIGVAYSTFMKWKPEIPELLEILKESKEVLIKDLEDTMYRKALGKCKVKTVKKYIEEAPNGDTKTKIEETVQDIAPDTTLLIFSLKNLTAKTGKWQDRREINTMVALEDKLKNIKSFSEKMEEIEGTSDVEESSPI